VAIDNIGGDRWMDLPPILLLTAAVTAKLFHQISFALFASILNFNLVNKSGYMWVGS